MTRVRRPSDTFNTGLVWFRRDLRSTDNDALYQALKHRERAWCVIVLDTTILQPLIDSWQARQPMHSRKTAASSSFLRRWTN